MSFLKNIGIEEFELWNEGYGDLAFRLIRPNRGDGYPFSCKNWGPGAGCISMWIPILGFEQDQQLNIVPGSHLKKYEKYLPINSKFIKNEYRLAEDINKLFTLRPKLKQGDLLIFHPQLLHSEEVYNAFTTRLNLEFRVIKK